MEERERSYRRIMLIFGLHFLLVVLILIQLVKIQVFNYPKFAYLATKQRQVLLLDNQLRGPFFDRNGRVLRGPSRAWYLSFDNVGTAKFIEVADKLEPIIRTDLTSEYQKWQAHQKESTGSFWVYSKPLDNRQVVQINALNMDGVKIIMGFARQDFQNGIAWHVLGYPSQNLGLSGLEYLYQPILKSKGNSAAVLALTDGKRHFFKGLGLRTTESPNPAGVALTIDARIQSIVEQVIDKSKICGAIVVLDAQNGDILAMTSRPLVDFNNIAHSCVDQEYPFLNRAISAFHPGSIFKLVLLSAGLDSGQLNEDELFFDQGYCQIGAKKWWCTTSGRRGHGYINLTNALAYSCNPVFIQISLRLDPRLVLNYADKFGFGQPCNIGLRDESWGELPAGIGLMPGELANMALGQQDVYTTPLQVASMVQTIANDGVRNPPRLVKGVYYRKELVKLLDPNTPGRVISVTTARTIQKMMTAVIEYGTGMEAQIPGGAGGKTGTAQPHDNDDQQQHAWFAGFAPLIKPRYITVVFCEKGISGGKTAAPLFKEVMEKVTSLRD